MTFTPKFVDLARNFATVQGNGQVTLGAPVHGYTSIADALTAGDRFYYTLQGVDKPHEREIGRGTLEANGKVAREAVSGSLTNFSSGTKTIALVAAAEWFNKLELGGAAGGGSIEAASIAALAARTVPSAGPALLVEAGREGLFAWDETNLSAQVAADTAQGIYVAPASDPTGASGAWVRRFGAEPVNPAWFGLAEANSAAANSAAVAAMLATLKARAVNVITSYQGLEVIRFPAGGFDLAETIVLTDGTTIMEGTSMGFPAGHATRLNFPAGVTGIIVQRHNTYGATGPADSPTHKGGQSIIRNLALFGAYTNAEAEAHGIQLRGQARIENVFIDLFEGDGIYAYATIGDGTNEGNANLSSITHCRIQRCRNGVYFDGADSNSCTLIGVDCSSNRRWGFYDSSFLGNAYFGCHTATNNLPSGGSVPATVTYNGNRYGVIEGQAAGASSNAPSGTTADNSWWYYHSAGGVHALFPEWASGTTYRSGGSYFSDNANSRTVYLGCYTESDEGRAQITLPALIIGGFLATSNVGTAGALRSSSLNSLIGSTGFEATTTSPTGTISTSIGEKATDTILRLNHSVAAASTFRLKFDSANNIRLDYANGGSAVAFHITGNVTTSQFGTGAAVAYAFHPVKLMVGDSLANARLVTNGTAAPTTGAHGQGEFVHNRAPAAATDPIGWRCRVAGTPGTWDPVYSGVSIAVEEDGVEEAANVTRFNFTGAGVDVAVSGGEAVIDIAGGGGGADPWDRTLLTADYNNPGTVATTITDGTNSFSYTPPADSFYTIEADILVLSTDAANLPLISVYCLAGANVGYGGASVLLGGGTETGATQSGHDGWNNPGADVVANTATGALPAANVPFPVRVLVKGRSGSAPTEITIRMRCETGAADTCYVKAGSEMRTRAVAA